MRIQIEYANLLRSLHVKNDPLILFNIWDAGSAETVQAAGAKAIATSSWSVAASHGYSDGEKIPFDLVLANLERIVENVDLPVTIDLEGAYGQHTAEIQEAITKIIQAGAVGINFEDQIIDGEGLYSIHDQSVRIKAIREAAEKTTLPLFINARTDIFLKIDSTKHNEDHLNEAVSRAAAYAESGADGFFVPGLINAAYIEKLCKLSPIPVNIMISSDTPSVKQLSKLGVARISYGPTPYCQLMDALKEAGHRAFSNA